MKMASQNLMIKKLQSALKISGFNVRRDLCSLVIEKFIENNVSLAEKNEFDSYITKLCRSLENQCTNSQSIELDHINRAIEICLHSGYDKHETVFSVINAFDFPKFFFDPERRLYLPSKKKSTLLADADSKAQLFIDRYFTVLQRTKRNFAKLDSDTEKGKLKLQSVDYLLTLSNVSLEKTLILGSILQVSEGKYFLEDPSGIVQLDLSHAKYHGGFFVEGSFVLVNGYYEDKILCVSTVMLPPGEEYMESRPSFGNVNYFGGTSKVVLKDSKRLNDHMIQENNDILFFSDVWLDHPQIFEKLEMMFEELQSEPPIAFVFMGNFMSESHGAERVNILKKLFKQLGELIQRYTNLVNNSRFIFVPGMTDPCTPHIAPRISLPLFMTEEFTKIVPRAVFATNPCRIQYCTKEIVVFRADVLAKLLQGTLHKPKKEEIPDCMCRTIVSQGHLSPMPLNALPVHWEFDYTLRLLPLPDLVVVGDRSDGYHSSYKSCSVMNPGPFCDSGFGFRTYTPSSGEIYNATLETKAQDTQIEQVND